MDHTTIGARLREFREGRGLAHRDLMDISGVHFNTISALETGKQKPRPSTLRRLAKALGVDVEDLTGAPKAEAPLFSDIPERDPEERCVDYVMGFVDLIEGVTARLEEAGEAVSLEMVEGAADLHRLFLDRAAERHGLTRSASGLPAEEARALERLAVALDDLRSVVDEGYGATISKLRNQKAEVKDLGPRREASRTDEGRETEHETRTA
jgi:transcriptional regulator with XRE-family HTH domain